MKTKIIILIFISLTTISCSKLDDIFSNSPKNDDELYISEADFFKITNVVSSKNYSKQIELNANGSIIVTENIIWNDEVKVNKYHLTSAELETLRDDLSNLTSIKLNDKYGFDYTYAPFDLPVISIKYKTSHYSDSTTYYFPKENEMPIELNNLIMTLDDIFKKFETKK